MRGTNPLFGPAYNLLLWQACLRQSPAHRRSRAFSCRLYGDCL